ncbi:MAG: thymidine phosphorylase [Bdellovibrionaceae bacterium]|nr:thymidine phosphorylase [Pseudobdellovibrionaceae bacterium]
MLFLPAEIIKKKRNGLPLSEEEIETFVRLYTSGALPDYQMAALLMAIFFQGMNSAETLSLTRTMLNSGVVLDLSYLGGYKVDKHSTGGVGDKTSLILGPIVAAAGVFVPMISGRGLGHTGGTLDKLESIPGFNTQISIEKFKSILQEIGVSFIGQTKEICPADKKIYALRDVTATVESLPLICASIMSKKLAEGIDGLVLDVKVGSGAFMKTLSEAEDLANLLVQTATGYGKRCVALITNMDQPLGRFAGNALEVWECLEILRGQKHFASSGRDLYSDTRELSLRLSAEMLLCAGKVPDLSEGLKLAEELLSSGAALKKFEQLVIHHGGRLDQLPSPSVQQPVCAELSGYVSGFDTEKIGVAGITLRAGRVRSSDHINPISGIEFHVKTGDFVHTGQPLFTIHTDGSIPTDEASALLTKSIKISLQKPELQPLIIKRMG